MGKGKFGLLSVIGQLDAAAPRRGAVMLGAVRILSGKY
jgi:hypothetical protein